MGYFCFGDRFNFKLNFNFNFNLKKIKKIRWVLNPLGKKEQSQSQIYLPKVIEN